MKDRTIRVLLLAIVLVGAVIFVQEYWYVQEISRTVERLKTFDIDQASLSEIRFVTTNAVVDCSKDNGVWIVGEPEQGRGPADIAIFHQLIAALNSTTNTTTITGKELKLRGLDSSEYGFENPPCEIVAVDNRGRRSWEFGCTTPLGNEIYVRESGRDEIYTVSAGILRIIPADPDLLRNRVLFETDIASVKRVEIRGAGGFVRMVKESSNQWRLQQPIVAPADPFEVAAYLRNLYKIRIEDFFEDNVSDFSAYGLQNDTKQISVGSADGSSRTIILGDAIPGRQGLLYARRADDTSVFALQEDVLQLLELTAAHFRDARVLSLPKEDVTRISMKRGTELLTLAEDANGRWSVESPAAWEANPEAVYNLIDLWDHAVITEFDVATNAVSSEWILEFVSGDSGLTNRVEVLPAGDRMDGLLVRLNGNPAVFQINLPIVPESIIDPLIYKNRRIWQLKPSDITKLILQRTGGSRQVVERSASGIFVASETNGNAQVESGALDRTLNRLCNLETTEYIAYNPRSLDVYGLSAPALELYVGLANTNELGRVLLVGRESTDGHYSMIKGRDVVFYLDGDTVETLSSDLIARPAASQGVD